MRQHLLPAVLLLAATAAAGCRSGDGVVMAAPPPPPAEPALAGGRELIVDGGFESPAPGAWRENNWAKNQASFSRDQDRPWQGRFSQRIEQTRIIGSANCELVQPLQGLKPGDALLVRTALRGNPNGRPVTVQVRRWAKPWTTLAKVDVTVTEQWQVTSFPVLVPAGFDTADLAFFVDLHDESAVWVDGVSVTMLPPVDPRPPLAGNLLANGSFELGTASWVATFRNAGGLELASAARDRISPADWGVVAVDGGQALRLAVHQGGAVYLDSAAFPLRHGQPVRLSARVRGPAGGRVQFGLRHGSSPANAGWHLQSTTSNPDDSWRTIALEGVPGPAASGSFVELHTTSPGDWLLDEVRVEQAPGPARRREFSCTVPAAPPARLFRGAERPRLELRALHAAPGTLAAALRVDDAWDRPIATLPLAIPVDAEGRGLLTVDLPRDRFGAFRCALVVDGAEAAEALYALAPELPPPGGRGGSFFGGHFAGDPYSLALAERIGFRWLRLMSQNLDTNWMAVEPKQGAFRVPTAAIERALGRGFSVLGNLNSPPEWAARRTGDQPYAWWHSRLPAEWAQWDAYVRGTVAAFPGITAWEVGNEMDSDYLIVPAGMDKAAAYTELVHRTRTAVLAAAPQARLVGLGVANPDRPFWRECLAQGVAADLEVMAPHFYFEDLDPLEKRGFAASLADWRSRPGPTGAAPELWMGEGGMWLDRAPSRLRLLGVPACGSDLAAAQALVRIAAGFKGLGVARHFHYALATSPAGSGNVLWRSECNSLVDFDGSARPAAAAHAALVWLLDEAAPAGAETLMVDGVQVCLARFDHPAHGRITVAWSRAGIEPARVPGLLGQVREVRDLFGNPLPAAPRLSAAPVYLIAGKG